ncbi:MAG: hypothetical protein WB007_04805, partial [Candidatus Acidiferrales bacterium]
MCPPRGAVFSGLGFAPASRLGRDAGFSVDGFAGLLLGARLGVRSVPGFAFPSRLGRDAGFSVDGFAPASRLARSGGFPVLGFAPPAPELPSRVP